MSPVSLVVSAFARTSDARRALTPQLRLDAGPSVLLLVDLGAGRNRLGASILAQVFATPGGAPPDLDDTARLKGLFDAVQLASARGLLLAYHDRSDGGAIVAALEMAFAARCGLDIVVEASDLAAQLFSEELGALLQPAG